MPKLWFKAKRYGWGWYPSCWQGWAVVAAYMLAVILFGIFLVSDPIPSTGNVIAFAVLTLVASVLLIAISYWKGEKPRWRWGGSEPSQDK